MCALFAAGSEPRWKGDEFTVDVRKCAKCRKPIKVTKRVTANGMNQTKAAAEAALWSAVWDEHGSCTDTSATATSGDAGSSGGSSSGAHADAAGEADFPAVTTVHDSLIAARTGRRVPTRAEARFSPSPTSLRDRSERAEELRNARAAGSSAAGSSAGSSSDAGAASGTSAGSSAQTAPPSSTTASAQITPASRRVSVGLWFGERTPPVLRLRARFRGRVQCQIVLKNDQKRAFCRTKQRPRGFILVSAFGFSYIAGCGQKKTAFLFEAKFET